MGIITLECLAWQVFELHTNAYPHFYAFLTEGRETRRYLLKVSRGSEIQPNREFELRRKRLPPGKGHRQSTGRKPGGPLVPGHPGKPFTPLDPSSPSRPGSPAKEERGKGNTHTHIHTRRQMVTAMAERVGSYTSAFVSGATSLEKHRGDVWPHSQRGAHSNRVDHSVLLALL